MIQQRSGNDIQSTGIKCNCKADFIFIANEIAIVHHHFVKDIKGLNYSFYLYDAYVRTKGVLLYFFYSQYIALFRIKNYSR